MFIKKTDNIIPVRIRTLWKRSKPTTRAPQDHSVSAGSYDVSVRALAVNSFQVSPTSDQQISNVASSKAPRDQSSRNISDAVQIALPMVQAAAEAIPVAGGPLKAAIGGLLAVLQVMDKCTQNREDLDDLTCRLYNLSCHIANSPTPQTPSEEASQRGLIKMLEDTAIKLSDMQRRIPGSPLLAQDIAKCSTKINDYLIEFMALSQMQLRSDSYHDAVHTRTQLTQIQSMMHMVARNVGRISATISTGCVTVVDATGREHNMLLDQCSSFDRLVAFLPGILHLCRPDEAQIQRWYIDKGQYDFVIDDGINITKLVRECDAWSIIQPGTKIVMRIITIEASENLSPRYQCRCGTWNDLKVDKATVLRALVDGFTITCRHCMRRFQISITKTKKETTSRLLEESQASDDGPTVEAKALIRNFLTKRVLEEPSSIDQYSSCPLNLCLYLDPDGKHCLCPITCTTVPEHMISHIKKMARSERISCQWDGCSVHVLRHNFFRHIRNVHLGHYSCH